MLVDGNVIYPNRPDLRQKSFWLCAPCGAYVGCHEGTNKPFGTLADYETRRARNRAHAEFDPIWQLGWMNRKQAYAWLASKLGIDFERCHIGMFDAATCASVARIAGEFNK